MRGLTGRSRWGSELYHIVTARGVAEGLLFLQRAGCSPGGRQCKSDGGGWHMVGVQFVIMEDRLQGRGAAGARVVCFLSFFFFSAVLVMNQGIEMGTSGGRVHIWRPGLQSL